MEEAFLTTDRVMTVSFHKYGDYFPGTGALTDVGCDEGKYYTVNFPCNDGLDDDTFMYAFKKTIDEIMKRYDPEAVQM